MPKVSIITPAYNSEFYIKDAIHSVLSQTYSDFELIVVDDGSTDKTQEIVNSYVTQYPQKIKYIYQANAGPSKARNTAIEHSQGEYIALLDADDIWAKERLERQVKIFETNPKIALVHANITGISSSGKIIKSFKRNQQYLSGCIFEHLFLRKADIASSTVLLRKDCLKETGLFDEHLSRLGSEDRDLWLRIAQKFPIQYIDFELAYYRIREGSMSQDYAKMLKGRLYIVDKYTPEKGPRNSLRRAALAKIYRDLGDLYLYQQKFSEARVYYDQSIRFNPYALWSWINLFKAKQQMKISIN